MIFAMEEELALVQRAIACLDLLVNIVKITLALERTLRIHLLAVAMERVLA